MIALTALYRETGETNYLHATKRIADFVERFRDNDGRYQGYRGGIWFAESMSPSNRVYASTEHNLDLYAAFSQLYRTTGEARWLSDANHARGFVEAMWDTELGGYRTGTTEVDPEMRNESAGQLPLDTQSWSVAALSGSVSYADAISCAERNHRNSADGFMGFDFNEDRDGVWFEGTAQMVVAYAITGASDQVDAGRLMLHAAQQMPPPHGDGLGMVAASHDGVSTGFGFKLYRRLHIGATAWNVFAQLRYNPYYQTEAICHLTPVNVGRPDLFVVRVNGEGNRRYAVERTSDLKVWQPFATNSSASGSFSITNTGGVGQPYRFYRTRLLP